MLPFVVSGLQIDKETGDLNFGCSLTSVFPSRSARKESDFRLSLIRAPY